MNHKATGRFKFIAAILDIILSLLLFFIIQSIKSEWTYAFDKDAQAGAAILNVIAWFLLVVALMQFIEGIVHYAQAEREDASITDQKPQEYTHPEAFFQSQQNAQLRIDHAALENCIFCGRLTDKNNPTCQHCGRRRD